MQLSVTIKSIRKGLLISLISLSNSIFAQMGTDTYEYEDGHWSASNIILWIIIILTGVYYLGKNSNKNK
jgi:hypothetical protein